MLLCITVLSGHKPNRSRFQSRFLLSCVHVARSSAPLLIKWLFADYTTRTHQVATPVRFELTSTQYSTDRTPHSTFSTVMYRTFSFNNGSNLINGPFSGKSFSPSRTAWTSESSIPFIPRIRGAIESLQDVVCCSFRYLGTRREYFHL